MCCQALSCHFTVIKLWCTDPCCLPTFTFSEKEKMAASESLREDSIMSGKSDFRFKLKWPWRIITQLREGMIWCEQCQGGRKVLAVSYVKRCPQTHTYASQRHGHNRTPFRSTPVSSPSHSTCHHLIYMYLYLCFLPPQDTIQSSRISPAHCSSQCPVQGTVHHGF